jgi:hypothetical protein
MTDDFLIPPKSLQFFSDLTVYNMQFSFINPVSDANNLCSSGVLIAQAPLP